jgi:hypothetical protein
MDWAKALEWCGLCFIPPAKAGGYKIQIHLEFSMRLYLSNPRLKSREEGEKRFLCALVTLYLFLLGLKPLSVGVCTIYHQLKQVVTKIQIGS